MQVERLEDSNLPYKPIIIIGSARSGTSFFYDQICKHKDLSYVSRNIAYVLWCDRVGLLDAMQILGLPSAIKNMLLTSFGSIYFPLGDKFSLRRRFLLGLCDKIIYRDKLYKKNIEGEALFSRCIKDSFYDSLDESYFDPNAQRLYVSLIRAIQEIMGKDRFVDKAPTYSLSAKLLNKLIPNAKFIHIIRDGRAVAYSLFNVLYNPHETDHPYPTNVNLYLDRILGSAYRSDKSLLYNYGLVWEKYVQAARELSYLSSAKRYMEVRYEDLVSDFISTMKHVTEFCELPWYEDFNKKLMKVKTMGILRNMDSKWRKGLSESEKRGLNEATVRLRRVLGYNN